MKRKWLVVLESKHSVCCGLFFIFQLVFNAILTGLFTSFSSSLKIRSEGQTAKGRPSDGSWELTAGGKNTAYPVGGRTEATHTLRGTKQEPEYPTQPAQSFRNIQYKAAPNVSHICEDIPIGESRSIILLMLTCTHQEKHLHNTED